MLISAISCSGDLDAALGTSNIAAAKDAFISVVTGDDERADTFRLSATWNKL